MGDFTFYVRQGIDHLLDPTGLDHFYFIASFCLPFTWKDWRKLAWLVTAFTLGHSITLALATLGYVSVNMDLVEWLIKLSILASVLLNFWRIGRPSEGTVKTLFPVLLLFGLLHGLGFSNFLKSMLFDGEGIVLPLFGFNVGIELGQLLAVAVIMGVLALADYLFKAGKYVRLFFNGALFFLVFRLIVSAL